MERDLPEDPEIIKAMAIVGNIKHEASKLVSVKNGDQGAHKRLIAVQSALLTSINERQASDQAQHSGQEQSTQSSI